MSERLQPGVACTVGGHPWALVVVVMTVSQAFEACNLLPAPFHAVSGLKDRVEACLLCVTTFFLASIVTAGLAAVGGAASAAAGWLVGSVGGLTAVILHGALPCAAGRPALQALTCSITGVCALVAALTWRAIQARAVLAIVPVGAAGAEPSLHVEVVV